MGTTIIVLAMVFATVIEVYTWKAGVVPMPTMPRVRRTMLSMAPEKINGDIWELGCGWGGLLLALAKKYPHHQIIGYEISLLPYWVCRARLFLGRHHHVALRRENFMDTSFEEAGVVLCYLSHKHMAILKSKFEKELKEGATVVSSTFSIQEKKPYKKTTSKGWWDVEIFRYEF